MKAEREVQDFRSHFPDSASASSIALSSIAGGYSHDGWSLYPFNVIIERAAGPYKWTIDGHQLIDFGMGHGALIHGHAYPPVLDAVTKQLLRGHHFGGPHMGMIEWAQLVTSLVPSVKCVRFTASGTEAVELAVRVARACTGRKRIIRFDGHYHGWGPYTFAHIYPAQQEGFSRAVLEDVLVLPPNDPKVLHEKLDKTVAAVLIEPGGGSSGAWPVKTAFLEELRATTIRNGSLLIFDETITGFRISPGGVQAIIGIMPDITILGKILGGGFPCGAIGGSYEVMSVFGSDTSNVHVHHSGTYNAHPISAAAGVAMLRSVADGLAQKRLAASGEAFAAMLNEAASEANVDVSAIQSGGVVHLLLGAHKEGLSKIPDGVAILLAKKYQNVYASLRRQWLVQGVDCHVVHAWLGTVHTDAILEEAVESFRRAVLQLCRKGLLPKRYRGKRFSSG